MALATLSIDLEARLAKLEDGMSRATRVAEKNAAAIEARYARIGSAVRTVAGVVATAFAGVQLGALVRSTIDGVDALNDLRDATGASIENLSALEDVALRTGTGVDEMGSSLIRFNKVLADAKPGSDAANIIKSLGLDVARLRALDPAEALRQVAVALNTYAVEGDKARAIQELFGKSVAAAAPFLAELAKQGQLVATVTTQQADEAEKFNQQLAALQKNSLDVARSLTSSLIPAINQLIERTREGAGNGGFFNRMLADVRASAASDDLRAAVGQLQFLQKALEGNPSDGFLRKRVAAQREEVDRLTAAALKASDALKATFNVPAAPRSQRDLLRDMEGGFKPQLSVPDGKKPTAKAAEIDDATRALAQYVAQLDKERGTVVELSEEQQALNFLKSLGTRGQVPQVRELVLGLAAEVDQRRENVAQMKLQADAQEAITRRQAEARRALDSLLAQTPSSRGGDLASVSGDLDEAFIKGEITATKYAEALALVDKQLAELGDPAKKAAKELDEFSKQAARNIQDALGDTVLATIQGKFDTIGQLWGNLIQRMAAQALSAKLGELLLGDFGRTGNVGGVFGSLFSLFGFHVGGVAGQGGEPVRYHGGGVAGLRADEVPAILLKGEEVIPRSDRRHRSNGGLSAGRPVVINQYVDGGMNKNEVYAAISLAMNAMRGEVQQTLRNAGVA